MRLVAPGLLTIVLAAGVSEARALQDPDTRRPAQAPARVPSEAVQKTTAPPSGSNTPVPIVEEKNPPAPPPTVSPASAPPPPAPPASPPPPPPPPPPTQPPPTAEPFDSLQRAVADATIRQADYSRTQTNVAIAQAVIAVLGFVATAILLVLTRKSSDAAAANAKTAERALVLLNRSYLNAENWRVHYKSGLHMGDSDSLKVFFDVVNSSPIPCRWEGVSWSVRAVTAPEEKWNHDREVTNMIGPRQAEPFPVDIDATNELDTNSGQHIIVSGVLKFRDMFTPKGAHRTKHFSAYCILRRESNPTGAPSIRAQFLSAATLGLGGLDPERCPSDSDLEESEG